MRFQATIPALITTALVAIVATALVIYLSPLKYLDLIEPPVHEIDPQAFWQQYNANPNDFVFIDVRSASMYETEHAKDAVNISAPNFTTQRLEFPRHGKTIALICTDGRLAAITYGYLAYYGFTNIEVVQGGLQNWITENLPVETGAGTSTIKTS